MELLSNKSNTSEEQNCYEIRFPDSLSFGYTSFPCIDQLELAIKWQPSAAVLIVTFTSSYNCFEKFCIEFCKICFMQFRIHFYWIFQNQYRIVGILSKYLMGTKYEHLVLKILQGCWFRFHCLYKFLLGQILYAQKQNGTVWSFTFFIKSVWMF